MSRIEIRKMAAELEAESDAFYQMRVPKHEAYKAACALEERTYELTILISLYWDPTCEKVRIRWSRQCRESLDDMSPREIKLYAEVRAMLEGLGPDESLPPSGKWSSVRHNLWLEKGDHWFRKNILLEEDPL